MGRSDSRMALSSSFPLLLASLAVAQSLFAPPSTNICGLKFNYCPRDPGCTGYHMSVHDVKVHDDSYNSTAHGIKIQDVSVGSKLTVTVSGLTTLTQVPVSGSYRIYSLLGGNVADGVLTDVMRLGANGSFTLELDFTVESSNFGASKDEFEFGMDVFLKKSGSDEGMCIQVESDKYVAEAKAKVSPPFDILCKDQGDGHFVKLSSPASMPVFDIKGAVCGPPPPPPGCALNWYYCPRDPGCSTYTMSVDSVEVDTHDPKGYKAGDKISLLIHGTTSLTSVPAAGSYRIYTLSGHNAASGVLKDVMKLNNGTYTLDIDLTLTEASFSGSFFEFGLDVFQGASGSDEGVCIEVANPAYVASEKAKTDPAFVTDCKDEGHGRFVKGVTAEVVHDVICKL